MSSKGVWLLKKGSEKKFHYGHPWVFSSELAQSPKGIDPGQLIELRDLKGSFLAVGYGHPNSLISFRTLSLDKNEVFDANFFAKKFAAARRVREIAGVAKESHRFVFAEGDFLPGLVIDRFLLESPSQSQVFVVQTSTAGMDRLLPEILQGLELFVRDGGDEIGWEKTAVVVANDSKSRVMEGLEAQPKRVEKDAPGFDPVKARIVCQYPFENGERTLFDVDFAGGQKTGFFLDQRLNVRLAAVEVVELAKIAKRDRRPLRILDLFCYVGQWGTQLAHVAKQAGADVEVTLVDASARALELAAANVERVGGVAVPQKCDVLVELPKFERAAFDVVICDPPAFVKKKKDLPTGSQAYFKVNREAIKKTRQGGLFVSCSCSGLFDETEFRTMLSRVTATYDGKVRWIARGSHSVDHPQRPEFPQGTYLKSWLGLVD